MSDKKNEILHNLKIVNGEISLDSFTLKGVTGYELKSDAVGAAELVLKLKVKSSSVSAPEEKKVTELEVPVQEQPKILDEELNKSGKFELTRKIPFTIGPAQECGESMKDFTLKSYRITESCDLLSTRKLKDIDVVLDIVKKFMDIVNEKDLNTRQVNAALELIQAEIKECKLKY